MVTYLIKKKNGYLSIIFLLKMVFPYSKITQGEPHPHHS